MKFNMFNTRVNFFIFIIVICFGLLISRLFYLQISKADYYRVQAKNQYIYNTDNNFNRRNIYFKDYKKSLAIAAQMSNQYDLAIDPRSLKSTKNLYFKLKEIFDSAGIDFMEESLFQNKILKNSAFEILATNLNEDLANQIKALNLRGLIIKNKKSRFYPELENAAKVLGFVGWNDSLNTKVGLYGLEKYYNDILNVNNQTKKVNFFAEVFSDLSAQGGSALGGQNNSSSVPVLENSLGDLNLTLDIGVQRFLNNILLQAKEKWNSETIGGIIMDTNDGAILAMQELPSFDPNNYAEVKDIKYYNNNLISGVYEMGSIIKPLTIAAALDAEVVNQNTVYNDKGTIELNGFKISNYDKKARGENTKLQTVLDKSLNLGIAFVVQKMGGEILKDYFRKYGLGKETGIDLPNEVAGLTKNLDSPVMVDLVTAGFGQGIALTPIQTIRALAVLANGGKLVNPHLVESITNQSGEIKKIIPDIQEEVFQNASTSRIISEMLIHVVDKAMKSPNPNYSVAAKTGTAQLVDAKNGKYFDDKFLHSFFGYFPAKNPRYIIFLYQVDPKGAEFASQTLKESFFNLVQFLISYFEIPPDRNGVPKYKYE